MSLLPQSVQPLSKRIAPLPSLLDEKHETPGNNNNIISSLLWANNNNNNNGNKSLGSANPLAEAFYQRLAALTACWQSYNQYSQTGLSPIAIGTLLSQYHQQALLLQAQQRQHNHQQQPPSSQSSPVDLSSPCESPKTSPSLKRRRHDEPDDGSSTSVVKRHKRKVSRRLAMLDDEKTSPVSGTIIRELADGEEIPPIRKGDIDPEFNVVEVTDEAKAELAKIENKIGDFICRLCKEVYDDAFGLAQHRCSMIVHVEYRCPECDKVFNCPANLASHRRWHKPKPNKTASDSPNEQGGSCDLCGRKFKKMTALKKHVQLQCCYASNNNNNISSNSSSSTTSSPATSPSKYSIAEILGTPEKNNNSFETSPVASWPLRSAETDELSSNFSCRLCSMSFSSVAELSLHLGHAHFFKSQFPLPPQPPPPALIASLSRS